jgi:DNA-directed RNA polymerase specialized sigma24 family protein
VTDVTADLISRTRAGDGDVFRRLTEPYRCELHVHCDRMLRSVQDAEDTLQKTPLAAWQGFKGSEGRASLRTWLDSQNQERRTHRLGSSRGTAAP